MAREQPFEALVLDKSSQVKYAGGFCTEPPPPPDFNVEKANLQICVLPDGRFPGQKFASRLTEFLSFNIEIGGVRGGSKSSSINANVNLLKTSTLKYLRTFVHHLSEIANFCPGKRPSSDGAPTFHTRQDTTRTTRHDAPRHDATRHATTWHDATRHDTT